MKVLYFHQFFTTREGSGGTRSYEMARRLVEAGHQVTVVCASNSMGATGLTSPVVKGRREGIVDGIRVIEFPLGYSNKLSLPKRAMLFARFAVRSVLVALREDYDLLFATSAPLTAAVPGIAMKALRRPKKPFVFEIRDPWPEAPVAMGIVTNPWVIRWLSWLEKKAYRAADRHIALSPGMIEAFERLGVSKDRITMVPNGADNVLFRPNLEKKLDLPGVEPGDVTAVFCGAHGIANGLDGLLDAAKVLQDRGVAGLKIVLIGDGKVKSRLQERADKEGIRNVVFAAPLPKTQLAAMLPKADIGLMILDNIPTFYYGSSPNKFFDYLACGLPVVVNHPGWVADLLREHQCGIPAAPENPAALADAIETLARDAALRRSMGSNGRKLAEREFDRDALGGRFVAALDGALEAWQR